MGEGRARMVPVVKVNPLVFFNTIVGALLFFAFLVAL